MKKVFLAIVIGIAFITLTGCTSSKSFVFEVETGDSVEVRLDTSDGYDLSSTVPFSVSKGGNTLSQGTFIKGDFYEQYVNAAETQGQILDKGTKDNIEYVFYTYNNTEFNYVINLKNSNTALLLGNNHSREEAEKCFELLSFELAE